MLVVIRIKQKTFFFALISDIFQYVKMTDPTIVGTVIRPE